MNRFTTRMEASALRSPRHWVLAIVCLSTIAFPAIPALANKAQVPWECSNYSDEAQTRCLNAFIEQQREQIGKLEGQLHAQQEAVGQLKGQIDRQAAKAADVQQQLSQRPVTVVIPAPYAFTYTYPSVGVGLYLGRPWIYGPLYFYGRLYWGPRYHGRWGRHW
jgi:septal ring factor EnvC (AmiA/AmiB activator)